jgi:restriction system protein
MTLTLTWNDAAESILKKENKALKYSELAQKIVDDKLVESQTKTPSITLYACISQENQAREGRGKRPRFTIAHGEVSLTQWETSEVQESFSTQVDQLNKSVKKELLQKLLKLSGDKFESFIEALLIKMEYEQVELCGGPTDEGIDLLCEMSQGINQVKTGVQSKCKQPQNKIGPKDVRLLRDVLPKFKCSQGVLITTSDFTAEAKAAASEEGRPPIILIDGDKLTDLAIENGVGVKPRDFRAYFVDEEFPLFM